MNINLNNKKFKALDNSSNGDVTADTIFHYRQEGDKIWASYAGGNIELGTLIGKLNDNKIILIYQQLNLKGEFLTGVCNTEITIKNEKIQLNEKWQWTCKDYSKGDSLLEEIKSS
ncbi:n-acetylglutamate synthase [uncultured Aquimarina sp.]|uniref:n-acetylglutamate synthase n=1 Tax=uncultured Aquimarina sp. TaxID=575652 RepID=UPI002629043A|nr:n-acetylglutamate synthase [uncultured Aquimarina sp.]